MDATKQMNCLCSCGLLTNFFSRDIRVGITAWSSYHTVSQLNCLTASKPSFKSVSWVCLHTALNSASMALAMAFTAALLPGSDVSGAEVNLESVLRASLFTAVLRQGV